MFWVEKLWGSLVKLRSSSVSVAAAPELSTPKEKPFPFLFPGIIFKLSSSPGHSIQGGLSLPPVLNYTIRMSSRITQTTNRIRERIWTVGPHNSTSQSQIYSRAFIYIQDSIERAIIELQTGKKPEEIAVQVQAMPYPCYNKDM